MSQNRRKRVKDPHVAVFLDELTERAAGKIDGSAFIRNNQTELPPTEAIIEEVHQERQEQHKTKKRSRRTHKKKTQRRKKEKQEKSSARKKQNEKVQQQDVQEQKKRWRPQISRLFKSILIFLVLAQIPAGYGLFSSFRLHQFATENKTSETKGIVFIEQTHQDKINTDVIQQLHYVTINVKEQSVVIQPISVNLSVKQQCGKEDLRMLKNIYLSEGMDCFVDSLAKRLQAPVDYYVLSTTGGLERLAATLAVDIQGKGQIDSVATIEQSCRQNTLRCYVQTLPNLAGNIETNIPLWNVYPLMNTLITAPRTVKMEAETKI